ncbi:MAG: chromate transporter [Acetobacter sp.]|nr:chromate transporter [Acetobacter sp.]
MSATLGSLIINFWQIGTFSIGGGYAIITLIEDMLVNQYHWLTMKEYVDIITISQMTPGPLAINASSFVGMKMVGIVGAVLATLSCIFSGVIISLGGYKFFCCFRNSEVIMGVLQGLKAVATGLIGAAGAGILLQALTGHSELSLEINTFDFYALIITSVSLFLLRRYKTNPVWILLLSAGVGILIY